MLGPREGGREGGRKAGGELDSGRAQKDRGIGREGGRKGGRKGGRRVPSPRRGRQTRWKCFPVGMMDMEGRREGWRVRRSNAVVRGEREGKREEGRKGRRTGGKGGWKKGPRTSFLG